MKHVRELYLDVVDDLVANAHSWERESERPQGVAIALLIAHQLRRMQILAAAAALLVMRIVAELEQE